jgi:hypothetical protein
MDGNALSIRSSQLLNKGIPPWELGTENLVTQSPYVCGGGGGGGEKIVAHVSNQASGGLMTGVTSCLYFDFNLEHSS